MSNFVSNSDAQMLFFEIGRKKLAVSDTMAAAGVDEVNAKKAVLYIGSDTLEFTQGVIYQAQPIEVTPTGSENPQALGWLEYNDIGSVYYITSDTTVDPEATYYAATWIAISKAEVDLSKYKTIYDGTLDSWKQLTDEEKAEYQYMAFEGDESEYYIRDPRERKVFVPAALKECITADGVDLGIKNYAIGDYYTDGNYTYVIADVDTFYGGYDSYAVVNTHHIALLVIGKAGTIKQKWNTSNTTSSGYNGSALHTALNDLISTIETSLGSTLLSHRKQLTIATSNCAWQPGQKISALTESQVYGAPIWSIDGYQQGEACRQLEVFRKFSFNEIFGNQGVWLRSIYSASEACLAYHAGSSEYDNASSAYGLVGLILFN